MPRTVLTIEDQADIRRLVRMTLEFEGFAVLESSNGAEGLVLARRHRPDLILLDVMMPGLNGLEVIELLATDPVLSRIPVILLSALDQDKVAAAGTEACAHAFLTKPFNPVELLALVDRFIDLAQAPS